MELSPAIKLKKGRVAPIVFSTVINSTVEKVWDVMIDFKNYKTWNRWYRIDGEAKVGACLKVYGMSSDDGFLLDLQVSSIEKNQSICWFDVSWFTYFGVGGWRCRTIEALPDGKVKFTNHFEYSGLFQSAFRWYTHKLLEDGMQLENDNIREFLEGTKTPRNPPR